MSFRKKDASPLLADCQSKNVSASTALNALAYDKTYKNKEMETIKSQQFFVQDTNELSDLKSLAEFYRDFFKCFTCSLKDGITDIYYDLLCLHELDEDLDFDELHYSRILGEFERVLDLYAKELCKNTGYSVHIDEKDVFKRRYSLIDGTTIKYEETYVL